MLLRSQRGRSRSNRFYDVKQPGALDAPTTSSSSRHAHAVELPVFVAPSLKAISTLTREQIRPPH
jgi:hypothetical protein